VQYVLRFTDCDFICRFDLFETDTAQHKAESALFTSAGDIDYRNLWSDLRITSEEIHRGVLKSKTLENLQEFVTDSPKLALVLSKLIKSGKKLFLLTNSPWFYTNGILTWMLREKKNVEEFPNWWDFFSVVIVDAQKPNFFLLKNEFREIEKTTGTPKLGKVTTLTKGKIYCCGNLDNLEKMSEIVAGNSVLYVGDHIFSDVLISKKRHAWRTLLIIPELEYELQKRKLTAPDFARLIQLETQLCTIFAQLPPDATDVPETVQELKKTYKMCTAELDKVYNKFFGSMLRCKLSQSFFAMQVSRYADLYTTNIFNLLNYSMVNIFLPQFFCHCPMNRNCTIK